MIQECAVIIQHFPKDAMSFEKMTGISVKKGKSASALNRDFDLC
jgi:hypothetical protein